MDINLIIGGMQVDVDSKATIALNYKNSAFLSADKISGSHTNTLTLPRTARNEAVFGCVVSPSSTSQAPYFKLPAVIVIDGIQVVNNAYSYITEVTPKAYKVVVVWDVASELATMAADERTLNELPIGNDDGEDWRIITKPTASGNSVSPNVDYGLPFNELPLAHPAVEFSYVLRKVCKSFGLTPPPDEDLEFFANKRIPLINRIDPILENFDDGVYNNVFKIEGNGKIFHVYPDGQRLRLHPYTEYITNTTYGGSLGEVDPVTSGIVISRDLFARIDKSSGEYVNYMRPFKDNLEFIVDIDLTLDVNDPPAGWTMAEYSKVALELQYTGKKADESTTGWVTMLSIEPIYGKVGSKITLTYKGENLRSDALPPMMFMEDGAFADMKDVNIYWVFANVGSNNIFEAGSGRTPINSKGYIKIKQHSSVVSNNEAYYYVPNLPAMKCIDFVKSVATLSGRAAALEGDQLRFLSHADFAERISESDYNDWTNYVVGEPMQQMTFAFGDWAQKNIFKYKDAVYRSSEGILSLNNATLDKEKVIELPYTFPDVGRYGYMPTARIPLYEVKDDGTLEYNGGGDDAYIVKIHDNGAYTSQLYIEEVASNYETLKRDINQAKVVKVNFKLSMPTLATLDIRKPIYLRQFGCYFAIVELKVKNNGIAEVELLKLNQ